MKFNSVLFLSTIILLPIGSMAIGCFSGGQTGDCGSIISQFCNDELQNLLAGETRSQCYQISDTVKCDMKVRNDNSGTENADIANCISVNTATNSGCHSHGGIASSEGFEFTLDPNRGNC